MTLTVIKQGGMLRILESSIPIPDGTMLHLMEAPEAEKAAHQTQSLSPLDHLQLESAFAEEDIDWGPLLEPLLLKNASESEG